MKKFYFTPGPSQLYFTVEEHLKQAIREDVPCISHRSKAYKSIHADTVNALRVLLDVPDTHHILLTSSATDTWERIIQNMVAHESFHLVNGAFSKRFCQVAEQLGRKVQSAVVPSGCVVDVNKILIPESAELIAVTHNETSTGAMHPVEDIAVLRKAFPNQLIAVDIVSSTPYVALDYSMVDTAYFSVQKCFGLPAGLGVWIVNGRCLEKAHQLLNKGLSIGSYRNLITLTEMSADNQTPETPNALGIYLLGKVSQDMLAKGVEVIRRETIYKSTVLYEAIKKAEGLHPFVKEEKHRSPTAIVAACMGGSEVIMAALEKKGIILGNGYGEFKNKHIRIANFPTHSKEMVERLADELLS